MPSPDTHYTLSLTNHKTGERLKIEMIGLPFPGARSSRAAFFISGSRSPSF